MWQSPLYTDLLQNNERIDLEKTFGPFKSEHIIIEINPSYFEEWQELIQQKRNRRGEVALAIENPDGDILLHTKSFYPDGIYRIPTGGLNYGEKVFDCINREVYEETGFTNYTKQLLAAVFYEFKCQGNRLGFLSFLVKIKTMDLIPAPPMKVRISVIFAGLRWMN